MLLDYTQLNSHEAHEMKTELVELDRFEGKSLLSERDSAKLVVTGIAESDTPDTIYFTDSYNSKLKSLNIKTRQFEQVCELYFYSLKFHFEFLSTQHPI